MDDVPPEDTKQVTAAKIARGPLAHVNRLCKTFASVSSAPAGGLRLVSVMASNYCEKVRWGLDIVQGSGGLEYVEDAHPPGITACYTTELDAERSGTPIVAFSDGRVLSDSTAILRDQCAFLYDERGEALRWEQRLDRELGPAVRVFAYHHVLKDEHVATLVDACTRETSWIERALFKLMVRAKVIQPNMRRLMHVNEEQEVKSLKRIRELFDDVGDTLDKNGGYLVDGDFSAADLTFAALSSPVLDLDEFRDLAPPRSALPREIVDVAKELRATPAGQHAIRCYRDYRFATLDATAASSKLVKNPTPRTIKIRSGGPRNNVINLGLAVAAPLLGIATAKAGLSF